MPMLPAVAVKSEFIVRANLKSSEQKSQHFLFSVLPFCLCHDQTSSHCSSTEKDK